MEAQRDFKELLALFNAHNVEYAIVGAYALSFYGVPRYTGDLDIFIRPEAENARRILDALSEFGFGNLALTTTDFVVPNRVIQLGYPPVRVDLITSITGVSWREVADNREMGKYGGIPVFFIGRAQLVKNKRLTGRQKDLADLEALGESA